MLEIIVLFHDPISPKPQLSDRQPHILLQNTSVYEFMVDSVTARSPGHVVLSVQLSFCLFRFDFANLSCVSMFT